MLVDIAPEASEASVDLLDIIRIERELSRALGRRVISPVALGRLPFMPEVRQKSR